MFFVPTGSLRFSGLGHLQKLAIFSAVLGMAGSLFFTEQASDDSEGFHFFLHSKNFFFFGAKYIRNGFHGASLRWLDLGPERETLNRGNTRGYIPEVHGDETGFQNRSLRLSFNQIGMAGRFVLLAFSSERTGWPVGGFRLLRILGGFTRLAQWQLAGQMSVTGMVGVAF